MNLQANIVVHDSEFASDYRLISVMRQGQEVRDIRSFDRWMGDAVIKIFHARYWAHGIGQLSPKECVILRHFHEMPEGYFRRILHSGHIASPMLPRWEKQRRPFIFSLAPAQASTDYEQNFVDHGLRTAIAHGQMDRQDGLASHFAFVGCDHPFQAPQVKRLELLVPHMHAAIFRLENRAPCASGPLNRSIRLTRAEREIIRWICLGKTNAEIAIITERSIRTVNNQVAGMLSKLSFSNRVQLVVWALRSGCVEDL